MLTPRGWLLGAAAIGLAVAGRLFGIYELFLLAAGAAVLVVAALVLVLRTGARLTVSRQLHPQRVHAGSPARVELRVVNRASRRSPVLTLHDPVGEARTAVVGLAPLPPGEEVSATYRVPSERRGLLALGPLRVEVSDPFGLASVTADAAPRTELTVWPAVDPVDPLPHTTGDDPLGPTDRQHLLSARGEEFYALRPYVTGDDLRRVNWRATARRGELTVRQDELAWQGRSTVLLDNRGGAFSADGFERAVSGAASIVMACARHGHLVRLLTTDGHDSGFGVGPAHLDQVLERLATVDLVRQADGTDALVQSLAALRRAGGGAVAAVVGGTRGVALDTQRRLQGGFRRVVVVGISDDDHAPFPTAWRTALAAARLAARTA